MRTGEGAAEGVGRKGESRGSRNVVDMPWYVVRTRLHKIPEIRILGKNEALLMKTAVCPKYQKEKKALLGKVKIMDPEGKTYNLRIDIQLCFFSLMQMRLTHGKMVLK